jgi:hypothetical protein
MEISSDIDTSFQVTFATGPLGINLKSCLSGYGAYIDSFYSPNQCDQSSSMAEQKGLMIGDILLRVDEVNIELMELDEIQKLLLKLRLSPLTLTIRRLCDHGQSNLANVILDVRNRIWIKKFLREDRKSLPITKLYDEFIKVTELLLCIDINDHSNKSIGFWWIQR